MDIDKFKMSCIFLFQAESSTSVQSNQYKQITKQPTLMDILERSSSYEAGGQKTNEINQAFIYMICKDNMPFSCVEKPGLQKFTRVICPRYKLPSRAKVTSLVEQRYTTTKAILKNKLRETENIALTSDILTLTNSTRSFLVMTAHFLNATEDSVPELETVTLTAQRMYQAHTADYIQECFENIIKEFLIEKKSIHSMTTDGGSNMVSAVKKFLGDNKRIPCMPHLINLIVDAALSKDNAPVLELANQVKSIVTYFKQSVNAMDELRAEQQSLQKKEGEVLTLIQSVSTRWNSCLDMLERFNKLSAIVAKILSGRRNAPDMLTSSQLNVIRELITLLAPFKQATEDISGDHYVSASLAIPITNLLSQGLEHEKPSTVLGIAVKTSLLQGVTTRLRPLEENLYLAKATILDPRFKRMHFSSALAVSKAISELSDEIRAEHRRRGQLSPDLNTATIAETQNSVTSESESLWSRHEKLLVAAASNNATNVASRTNRMPNELKQYLDAPNISRKENPIKFWIDTRHFTPVLSNLGLKYLTPTASSVPSERVASAVNLAVPNNRSRLTAEHIKSRVFLLSLPDKYWFA
ncbi:unnamed protein product [Psylliodes chrysocephalus]|uniref:HAT C-terminal dimerisation domain-containing protein n=1 Tax=Psylliodes chrysocephalus TaxID=3402493 RepID=A0A9P0GF38_9CUCU|nr:unnamed protein product [Psylliodes chrysocephala]